MISRLLADAVVVLHLAFVAFVLFGGLLVLRRPRLAWVHVPAAVWGAWVEFRGLVCPLTPLENWLRLKAGGSGYGGGFVEHYLLSALYPAGLTRGGQIVLGVLVLAVNAAVYAWAWRRWMRAATAGATGTSTAGMSGRGVLEGE
jgi:hypothetical protein